MTTESTFHQALKQSAEVTEDTVTSAVDIPGLVLYLPAAGTYLLQGQAPWSAGDGTSRTMGIGLAVEGAVTFLRGVYRLGTAVAVQTTAGTLATFATQTGTAGSYEFTITLVTSTAANVKLQFSRSAAAITHKYATLDFLEGV